MLLQRILTAIPLAALVLWVILFQPSDVFAYLLYIIAVISAYEWARLSGMLPMALRALYAVAVLMICVVIIEAYIGLLENLLWLGVAWWGFVSAQLFFIKPTASPAVSWMKMLIGWLVIPVAVLAMYHLHQSYSEQWLLYGLVLVWVADIGAYFSGKSFGKHKLAPHISPGKTREGLLGAVIATSLYSLAAAYYFGLDANQLILLLLLSVVLTLVSVVGDLYESVLKREFGVKDSGNILPGHGGMLDRIDSVLAAMPVFALGLSFILQPKLPL
jgi:phosphatidate cytidylyltransferase